MQKVEILSPAGSYESFQAAVTAGADAVYAGGPVFGARAFAENFTEEQLLQAIDHAHLHGVRFYLTVNTLLKEKELDQLYAYLNPLYEQGLDAVIVQDTGVFEFVREHFPRMDIHASTQMTVTGADGARFLKEQGAVRVVPARELSLEEIHDIKENTGMEVECFVHGALCYCYSGQCLLSSLIGGRSGNRGQCAQPCRLPYSVDGKKEYLMSLKDICTLDLIPEMVEAGIDSFKIEGRMKKPEYVAGVTAMYRKYLDLYLEKGRDGFHVDNRDREILMDLYNRGGFHTGYYEKRNGREMLSLERPNHAGTPALKVNGQKGREVYGTTLTEIRPGDVLELSNRKENYTFGQAVNKGEQTVILAPKGTRIGKGRTLSRTRSPQVLEMLQNAYVKKRKQEPLKGICILRKDSPASLCVTCQEIDIKVTSKEIVVQAQNRPLEEEQVRRQLQKTGESEFCFSELEILLDADAFMPMQQIKELRKQALLELEDAICSMHRRTPGKAPEDRTPEIRKASAAQGVSITVETISQLKAVLAKMDEGLLVSRIYIESMLMKELESASERTKLETICGEQTEIFVTLPMIFRENTKEQWEKNRYERFLTLARDGAMVRNFEGYSFLREHGFDKKIILDHNLYRFNSLANRFWEKEEIREYTLPAELNSAELRNLDTSNGELIVYGYLPVMVSAQCIRNTTKGCGHKTGLLMLEDRYHNTFPVKNQCEDCYNIVYNTLPICLIDQKAEIMQVHPKWVRLQFSVENEKETQQVLEYFQTSYVEEVGNSTPEFEYTRGHFKRGIN